MIALLFVSGVYSQTDSSRNINNKMNEDGGTPGKELKPEIENNRNRNMQNNPDEKIIQKSPDKIMADGIMKTNGKMMVVNDGKMTRLEGETTLRNGTKVMTDGTIIKKDGTKSMLREGEHIDMSGTIIPMKN